MDNERNSKRFESVYSKKVRAGKRRTYFFDVRRTKGEDFYLTLTESTKRFDGGYERHKIFLYKEDFNRFIQGLEETINYIKTELMPQYDYDEFARRQDEYEARMAEENGYDKEDSRKIPLEIKGENSDDEAESLENEDFENNADENAIENADEAADIVVKKEKEVRTEQRNKNSNSLDDDDEDMSW